MAVHGTMKQDVMPAYTLIFLPEATIHFHVLLTAYRLGGKPRWGLSRTLSMTRTSDIRPLN